MTRNVSKGPAGHDRYTQWPHNESNWPPNCSNYIRPPQSARNVGCVLGLMLNLLTGALIATPPPNSTTRNLWTPHFGFPSFPSTSISPNVHYCVRIRPHWWREWKILTAQDKWYAQMKFLDFMHIKHFWSERIVSDAYCKSPAGLMLDLLTWCTNCFPSP